MSDFERRLTANLMRQNRKLNAGICLSCGADRKVLREMLAEPDELVDEECPTISGCTLRWKRYYKSENHAIADRIISCCPDCREYFSEGN